MKTNALINELARGYWAMSFEGMAFWAPIANKIMTGQEFKLDMEPKALISVYDKDMRFVSPDDKGNQEVPPGSVAVVNMVGVLVRYGDWCIDGSEDIVRALDMVEANPNFLGAVVYIDGPGGAVTAIPPFLAFGRRKQKPYVGIYEQACSAHLFGPLAFVDYMMAENELSATIGSCGVVLNIQDNKKLLQTMGYEVHEIYPDESEDKNLAVRLALEGKYDKIKEEMLSPMAVKGQNIVRAARPKLIEAPGVLTGRVFFPEQALEYNLIDSIGQLPQAINQVRILSEMRTLNKKN